jgi:tRNA G18 (ribose-2'-O)-methylase SpoU
MKLPVSQVTHLGGSLREMKDFGLNVIGITEKATDSIRTMKTSGPIALVLGNEETGIHPSNISICDETYRIEISEEIDSLNVSVAGAVAMYQASL